MKIKTCGKLALISSAAALLTCSAWASNNASDNAGNYGSWGEGTGGTGTQASSGTGFGAWQFNNANINYGGQFLGSSGSSPTINSGDGNAFGLYANNGASAESQAIAPFTGGSLGPGQMFSIQMMNGNISDDGGQVGFDLQTSTGGNLFQFYFSGGGSDYDINVNGNVVSTGISFTYNPLSLSFTDLGANNWSFTVVSNNVSTVTLSSTSTGDLLASDNIGQVDLVSLNGGNPGDSFGSNGNLFFNNLSVVPEPSTLAIFGASGLGTLLMFRRRK